jgi:hypothetical protein
MTRRIIVLGDLNLDVHVNQPDALSPGDEIRAAARDRLLPQAND